MAGLVWTTPPSVLAANLKTYEVHLINAVHALGDKYAAKMENEAKSNHPWANRTGAAEAGLTGIAIPQAFGTQVTLSHGVFYGIYLELKQQGKWGIVLKTLEANYGPFMADLQRLVG